MNAARRIRRAALYLRVSTDKQTVQNQEFELRQVAERRGWDVVEIYSDAGISGAKGRKDRPGLDRMLNDASRGKFDIVMAWAIDRIGRSLIDLLGTIQHLESCGVDLYLDQQNIDTTTPTGKLLFQITGAFAEFERTMIRQRINAGMLRAQKNGTKSGRPIGRPRVPPETEAEIKAMLRNGHGTKAIMAATGVGVAKVVALKRDLGIEVGARPGYGEEAE